MLNRTYRPRAQLDIQSIIIYLGQELDLPYAAAEFNNKLHSAVDQLCELPGLGRPISDNVLNHDYRSWIIDNYKLIYSVDETTLTVWRVIHVRQDTAEYAFVGLE